MGGVCDTAPQWHPQHTAAIPASPQRALGVRCAVLPHEHECVFRRRCCTWLRLPALVIPPISTTGGFQGSVLPRDQLSHDYVRDQRDRLSLISLTSVPTARQAATWIIEDIHMQICVVITPNNALCRPPESRESRADSCFNPFWQSVPSFPAQELHAGLGHLDSLGPCSPCWVTTTDVLSGEFFLPARLCKTKRWNLDEKAWSRNRRRMPDLIQKITWLV